MEKEKNILGKLTDNKLSNALIKNFKSGEPDSVITKDEFKQLKVQDVSFLVTDYNYSLISHTEYQVQISILDQYHYQKLTRYRHLEAFDTVLRTKFKNLDFP